MCVSIVIIWMYFYLVFHMNDLHIIWCDQQSNANFTYVIYIYHVSCRDVIKYFVNQSVSLLVLCEGYALGVITKLLISKAWTVNGEVIYKIHSRLISEWWTDLIWFIECFMTTFLHTHHSLLAKLGRWGWLIRMRLAWKKSQKTLDRMVDW